MRRLLTLLLCLGTAIGGTLGVPASAADPLPVTYSFVLGTVQAGADPSPSAPGSNDWTCRPSAAHPRPVVLVHGTYGAADTNWMTYSPLLKNNGYCVFALTYGATLPLPFPGAFGGLGDMKVSAQQLAVFVDRVLAATGATKVDIIGHSQGTLMPNYYAKFLGGGPKIGRYISLAPLWHGTGATNMGSPAAAFGRGFDPLQLIGPAFGQMGTGSAFVNEMRAGGVAVPGIEYTNIMTRYDELVQPYTSGSEPGMNNIVIQDLCKLDYAEHFQIAADRNASVVVLNTLDPAHPRPVPCVLVLPFVGGLL